VTAAGPIPATAGVDRFTAVARGLPEFPWDTLRSEAARAAAHADGLVDLSVGTPVDPVPAFIQQALAGATDRPGYPTTQGTEPLRAAAVGWMARRLGVRDVGPDAVLPVIGTKELVAWLPTLLGLGPGDTVVVPELAYPTYEVGAALAGATTLAADSTVAVGPLPVSLVWLNSPANPTGRVLPAEHLRKVVTWARERGAVVVSDECYIELGWDEPPVSVLHPDVCAGSTQSLLAVHSLSKRSNLAGYRAGFVAGDPQLVDAVLAVRKHAGMMMPAPIQEAMAAALADDEHVVQQRARYRVRRETLWAALSGAGFTIEHSQGGLYLWATRGEPGRRSVAWLAERGILVAPGDFYGPAGTDYIRVALTATDADVDRAAARLAGEGQGTGRER
jgi:succinyldiaminopimelate transaminase